MIFTITNTSSADEIIISLRAIIKRHNGIITESNRGGSFIIPFLFGTLNAGFILTDNFLKIHVSQHPLFVNQRRIENLFKQINKRNKIT